MKSHTFIVMVNEFLAVFTGVQQAGPAKYVPI